MTESNPLNYDLFVCQKTGVCCRQPGFVYLDDVESKRISTGLQIDGRQFRDQYCDLIDRRRLVLKKHADESCIFLLNHQCRIYSDRPRQCRDFPRTWRTEASFSYCAGLRALKKDSVTQ